MKQPSAFPSLNASPKSKHVPRATIQRLYVYLQVLEKLHTENVYLISSELLSKACNVTASQVRKDLTYFGEFGVRGVGYNVLGLINAINHSLGTDKQWRCVIVGVGNIAKALLRRREFTERGFSIVGIFDADPIRVGDEIYGMEVYSIGHLQEQVAELNVQIGIIATQPEWTQHAATRLVEAGIKGILSYARARVIVPRDVYIEYVDLFHHLYAMAFNLSTRNIPKDGKAR